MTICLSQTNFLVLCALREYRVRIHGLAGNEKAVKCRCAVFDCLEVFVGLNVVALASA